MRHNAGARERAMNPRWSRPWEVFNADKETHTYTPTQTAGTDTRLRCVDALDNKR